MSKQPTPDKQDPPVLFISGEDITPDRIKEIRKEIAVQLRDENINAKISTKRGKTREMSFSGSILLNLAAETVVKDVAKRIVEIVTDKISREEGLKVTFQQARALFTGDAPEVTFDNSSLGKDKKALVSDLLSTFGIDPDAAEKKALLIGCSKYDDPSLEDLKYADKNASDFAEVLGNREFSDFSKPVCLPNETKSRVESEIETMFRNAGKNDLVVLFFSGHGLLLSGKFFIACKDSKSPIAGDCASTCVSISFINNMIELSKCERFVIIVDCCYAGDAADDLKSMVVSSSNTNAINKKSIYWLFSCDKGNTTFESDVYKNSIFTKHLIEGITTSKADLNLDGEISLFELENYIGDNLEQDTSSTISHHPINAVSNTIIIAKNNRTLRERSHQEHKETITDLYQQSVITDELRHEWTATSEKVSKLDGNSFASDAEGSRKWGILRQLSEQKIKPSEAIIDWYSDPPPTEIDPPERKTPWLGMVMTALLSILGTYVLAQILQPEPETDSDLRSELVKVEKQLASTTKLLDTEKVKSANSEKALVEVRSDFSTISTENIELKRALETQSSASEKAERKYRDQIENLESEIASFNTGSIASLEQELDGAREQLESLKVKNRDLEEQAAARSSLDTRVLYGPSVIREEDFLTLNKDLQVKLNSLGCYYGFIDGDLGNQTQGALTASLGNSTAAREVNRVKNSTNFEDIRNVNKAILSGDFGTLRVCDSSESNFINHRRGSNVSGFSAKDLTRVKGRFNPKFNEVQLLYKKPTNAGRIRLVDSIGTVESVSVSRNSGGARQIKLVNGKATINVSELPEPNFVLTIEKRREAEDLPIPTDFSIVATLQE